MTKKQVKDAKRRKVWDATKSAASAYAHNPCAATAQEVESAVDHLRHLNAEAEPVLPKRRAAGKGR